MRENKKAFFSNFVRSLSDIRAYHISIQYIVFIMIIVVLFALDENPKNCNIFSFQIFFTLNQSKLLVLHVTSGQYMWIKTVQERHASYKPLSGVKIIATLEVGKVCDGAGLSSL